MSLDVIFATVVAVLAGVAVVGALVFVIVWEVCATRRTLADHRRQRAGPPEPDYWREHAALAAPAEHERLRDGSRRILGDESLREIALDWTGRGTHRPERRS